ncbi:hypothetical protein DFA_05486 [Cavenderia fasciculata]|uniref:F-box domain-containing protein n=1 Tax=Cavenderia fasciculata TaxID=261658 RepID=F4PLD2_CACFS|nr:uncharacterized protein DFA_05486 [Cavenderia fasciculata]EGG23354.1 hypothetical protein DFA_05486 [Cavenderia fasciculata]|eukprot:XP_004361205.1 hypothetical protein DFA_05486 [Cavenderia fasciculata]
MFINVEQETTEVACQLPLLIHKHIIDIYLENDCGLSDKVKRMQIYTVSKYWCRYIATFATTLYVHYTDISVLQDYMNHFSTGSSRNTMIDPNRITRIKFIGKLNRHERYRPSNPLFGDKDSQQIINFLNYFPNTKSLYIFNGSNISTTFTQHMLQILSSSTTTAATTTTTTTTTTDQHGNNRLLLKLEMIEYIDEHFRGDQFGFLEDLPENNEKLTFLKSVQNIPSITSLSYLNYKHPVKSNLDFVQYMINNQSSKLESFKMFGRFSYYGKFDTSTLLVKSLADSMVNLRHLDLGLVHILEPKIFVVDFLGSLPITLESLLFGPLKVADEEENEEVQILLAQYLSKTKLKRFSTRFDLSELVFQQLSLNHNLEDLEFVYPQCLLRLDPDPQHRYPDFSKTNLKRLSIRYPIGSVSLNIVAIFLYFKNVTSIKYLAIPQDTQFSQTCNTRFP